MIVSASRRTDIPALYTPWFMNRVRAGFCTVPNPYNPRQHARISLAPAEVDAIVFWTRNPKPLMPHLDELADRSLDRYIFLFTLLDYPKAMEPGLPSLEDRIEAFLDLSGKIGPERIIWRYDPVIISNVTDAQFHLERFASLATKLKGSTARCIFSIMEPYAKSRPRMHRLEQNGICLVADPFRELTEILPQLSGIAYENGMRMTACSQPESITKLGIENAPCVDGMLINHLFKTSVPCHKDGGQRSLCQCAPSRDIGVYDSCTHGCVYCYANADFDRSARNRANHDPEASSLTGDKPTPTLPLLQF